MVWLPALARVVACAVLGSAFAAVVGRGRAFSGTPFGWAPAALLAATACFAVFLNPWGGLAVTILVAAGARLAGPASPPPTRPALRDACRRAASWLGSLAGLVVPVAIVRPLAPLYWDEFVWLGKARLTAQGFGHLRAMALDPSSHIVPPGYPLLWPFVVGALAGRHDDVAPLMAGGRVVLVVALGAFLHELVLATREHARDDAGAASGRVALGLVVAVALASVPLVFVHARSVYVDLPTGLVAAALALRLARVVSGEPAAPSSPGAAAESVLPAVAYALTLTGLKDEGFLHVTALFGAALGVAVLGKRPWEVLFASVAPAWCLFGSWRIQLALRHVTDADHALGLSGLPSAPALARVWLAHALDFASWGVFWPVVVAAGVATLLGPPGAKAFVFPRILGAMLAVDVLALFAGVVLCPERVHEFAQGGTLVGRLLVQHAPLSAATIGFALVPAFERRRMVTAVR